MIAPEMSSYPSLSTMKAPAPSSRPILPSYGKYVELLTLCTGLWMVTEPWRCSVPPLLSFSCCFLRCFHGHQLLSHLSTWSSTQQQMCSVLRLYQRTAALILHEASRRWRYVWRSFFPWAECSNLVVGARKVLGKGLNEHFTRSTFGHGTHI